MSVCHGGGKVMDSVPTDWLPDAPQRSPAWRWLRAGYLTRHGRAPDPRPAHDWVLRARRFLAGERPGRASGALRGALALWQPTDPVPRWQLEAWLLTAEPLGAVARHCGVTPAVAVAYHELFFAVRP